MDLATILGLVIGTSLILVSMFLEAASGGISMLKFWSPSSIMIVLGGTLAATAVAFRLHEVKRVFMIIKFAFQKPKFQLEELVQTVIDLAEVNRKGPSELEKEISNIKQPFLQDGVTFDGGGHTITYTGTSNWTGLFAPVSNLINVEIKNINLELNANIVGYEGGILGDSYEK